MYHETMSQIEAIAYWVESAKEDWGVAVKLMADKKYHHALFFAQLVIEKLIKAFHKAGLKLTDQESENLKEISTFNITARYDSYKRDFYNKATPEYTQKWFELADNFRQLLLEKLK